MRTQSVDTPPDVSLLGGAFYADEERIREGVVRRASFDVIDLRNGFKADVSLGATDSCPRRSGNGLVSFAR